MIQLKRPNCALCAPAQRLAAMGALLAFAGTTLAGGPPNDDCINAIIVVEDDPPVPFSTVDATTDGEVLGCRDGNTGGRKNRLEAGRRLEACAP